MDKTCNICHSPMAYSEGISKKNNKPYAMYKCTNKQCGEVEWIRAKGTQKTEGQGSDNVVEGLRAIWEKLDEILEALKSKNLPI